MNGVRLREIELRAVRLRPEVIEARERAAKRRREISTAQIEAQIRADRARRGNSKSA